jgi:hypothetical protein
VVCLHVSDDAPPDAADMLRAALAALPSQIPEIRAYSFGPDAGLAPGNADFAIIADFDDADAWRRYQAHPAHVDVVERLVKPFFERRHAAQVEVD